MSANASGWILTTSAVSTAYTFPDGPTACASDAVRRPATISATLSPFLRPMNSMTCGAFQAGSTVGVVDCEDALVAAPIAMASVKDNANFRMCHSFCRLIAAAVGPSIPRGTVCRQLLHNGERLLGIGVARHSTDRRNDLVVGRDDESRTFRRAMADLVAAGILHCG